jgi:DNA-binding transcriptional ArsR family regulator
MARVVIIKQSIEYLNGKEPAAMPLTANKTSCEAMLDEPRTAQRAAAMFQAMGEPARLRILALLLDNPPMCVCDIAEATGDAVPTVSQRLKVLRAAGLLTGTRSGRHIHYAPADRHVVTLVRNALRHAQSCVHAR